MPIKIQKNIPLAKYTTFKIGGPARYFCVVKNADEIKEALKFAEKNKLKVFILGGGSNLLISDSGFDGLVIKVQSSKFKVQSCSSKFKVACGAGLPLVKLVSESVKIGLTGMEWAAGIPGTVGGAVCNNAGAFGKCMGDIVEEAEILDITPQPPLSRGECLSPPDKGGWRVKKPTNKQCEFSYRDSIFKKEKKYVIFNVVLKLERGNKEESKKKIAGYLKSRAEKQPLGYGSAGSVFRNPVVDEKHFKSLVRKYSELKSAAIKRDPISFKEIGSLDAASKYIIPTGWLIEELGLKGKKIGGAMISEKHGNFIVNAGDGKAEDVVILISLIKQKIRNNFGIQLVEEIEYVGF